LRGRGRRILADGLRPRPCDHSLTGGARARVTRLFAVCPALAAMCLVGTEAAQEGRADSSPRSQLALEVNSSSRAPNLVSAGRTQRSRPRARGASPFRDRCARASRGMRGDAASGGRCRGVEPHVCRRERAAPSGLAGRRGLARGACRGARGAVGAAGDWPGAAPCPTKRRGALGMLHRAGHARD